ncbi:hypothetical protein [Streptomyces sp. CB02959]|uniref:hypothetical protein n=1 Tax=Streptomyces sp. CB02959 TaxID=2020330 RepID=UPI0011AFD28F|nr:hypothetical protein [Streptomyces sp. CB02959]
MQTELVQAKADLAELYAALPWSVEELQGWSRAKETGGGYYESHRPDSPGWSDAVGCWASSGPGHFACG